MVVIHPSRHNWILDWEWFWTWTTYVTSNGHTLTINTECYTCLLYRTRSSWTKLLPAQLPRSTLTELPPFGGHESNSHSMCKFDNINYDWIRILYSQHIETAASVYPAVVAVPERVYFLECNWQKGSTEKCFSFTHVCTYQLLCSGLMYFSISANHICAAGLRRPTSHPQFL